MINLILLHEIKEYTKKMELVDEYPNIYLFLEKTLKTMETGRKLGL